jgi:hypothetical protein
LTICFCFLEKQEIKGFYDLVGRDKNRVLMLNNDNPTEHKQDLERKLSYLRNNVNNAQKVLTKVHTEFCQEEESAFFDQDVLDTLKIIYETDKEIKKDNISLEQKKQLGICTPSFHGPN